MSFDGYSAHSPSSSRVSSSFYDYSSISDVSSDYRPSQMSNSPQMICVKTEKPSPPQAWIPHSYSPYEVGAFKSGNPMGQYEVLLFSSYNSERTSPQPSGLVIPVGGKALLICKVCGDKASGYHYGVTSCEGCKVRKAFDLEKKLRRLSLLFPTAFFSFFHSWVLCEILVVVSYIVYFLHGPLALLCLTTARVPTFLAFYSFSSHSSSTKVFEHFLLFGAAWGFRHLYGCRRMLLKLILLVLRIAVQRSSHPRGLRKNIGEGVEPAPCFLPPWCITNHSTTSLAPPHY
ncbi:unnamed protein product [Angiostrongylus costaricensis]|uniref:Nuclear receptor domain-containing protein n=1 Tax=Angiostrongylus costaricensis TaxID=334426 RepID=A0A0R3PV84_ANGCS|nr:unnamed protein product [Angiostrongylus costaricensis]